MATIYDVAKLAGVSVGTVSNYLNSKYVGTAKSIAVKQAIDELHYAPNRMACALRSHDANRIMLILPNITEGIYSELAAAILSEMEKAGYNVQIACTGDSAREETRILKECFSNLYAGVFLCSCCPDETALFLRLQQTKPVIFLLRRPNNMDETVCYIGFDSFGVIYRITKALLDAGARDLALWTGPASFSCERACVKGFRLAFSDARLAPPQDAVVSLPFVREILFRQATQMFAAPDYPRFILTSSKLAADAIIEAAYYQNISTSQNLCVITLGDGQWSNLDRLHYSLSTLRSAKGLAQVACGYLQECISAKKLYEHRSLQLRDSFSAVRLAGICDKLNDMVRPVAVPHTRPEEKRLSVVCNDCDTGVVSIQYLTPWISKTIGIDIELKLLPVYQLNECLREQVRHEECLFDMIHLDAPWMQQFVSDGLLRDITDYFDARPDITDVFVPNLINATATINGRIYGAPTLLCSQMIFYRKDYFEDPVLQNRYLEMHGHPLLPPKTWFEYMMIARFFTRAFNPDSPCEYGTVMNSADDEMMLTEVFPRIWAYGGGVYDDFGNVTIYSEENVLAIQNYIHCLACSDHSHEGLLLPQCAARFAEGNAAIMVAYDVHASNLVNYTRSKVLDKIGFAPIPGGVSTMGGWNFCVNARSRKIKQCYSMLDGILGVEFALPYTLLGGCSPRLDIVQNPEVVSMFPWMKGSIDSFQRSRRRYVPEQADYATPRETDVERVVADVVRQSIREPKRIKDLLKASEHRLKEMRVPLRRP